MTKTYTIQTVAHTAVSPGKGSITWQLQDKADGRVRKVSGVTDLDRNGAIESAHSIYVREAPLVEELLRHYEGDTFTIDFTGFNQAQGYIHREIYANMRKRERLGLLSHKAWRVLAVLSLLTLLWLGWSMYASFNKFSQEQPLIHHELP